MNHTIQKVVAHCADLTTTRPHPYYRILWPTEQALTLPGNRPYHIRFCDPEHLIAYRHHSKHATGSTLILDLDQGVIAEAPFVVCSADVQRCTQPPCVIAEGTLPGQESSCLLVSNTSGQVIWQTATNAVLAVSHIANDIFWSVIEGSEGRLLVSRVSLSDFSMEMAGALPVLLTDVQELAISSRGSVFLTRYQDPQQLVCEAYDESGASMLCHNLARDSPLIPSPSGEHLCCFTYTEDGDRQLSIITLMGEHLRSHMLRERLADTEPVRPRWVGTKLLFIDRATRSELLAIDPYSQDCELLMATNDFILDFDAL